MKEGQRMEDTAGLGAELFGVPSGSKMYQPNITRGRWLNPDEQGNIAVISQDTADFNGVAIGDVVTIDMGERGSDDWVIIGTYQAIAPEPFATDPIYVPEEALVRTSQQANQARQILVRTTDPSAAYTVERLEILRGRLEERDISISMFTTRTKEQEREYANNQFGIVANLLFGLAVVMGIVGGIGLMGSLSISVVERTREIGVLRAIGAETPTIMGMFVMEGLLQGLLSWVVAVPLSLIIARPTAAALGQVMLETDLDFAFDYTAVLIWLVTILFISVAASLMPARNATKISVRESLAYG
jgi:putative ABC transport system permease protein